MTSAARPGARVTIVENAEATMRDGTTLRSDVYTPEGDGPRPVLVCRTAYGKRGETFGSKIVQTATGLAGRGYIVVVQDVRGRYASGGVYQWLYGPEAAAIHTQDGYDTVEWAATLPGASGQVGTWGNSYDGYTSLRIAGAAPPALAAAFASGVAETLHQETFGIFKPIYIDWLVGMAVDARTRRGDTSGPPDPSTNDMIWTVPYDAIDDDAFADLTEPFKTLLREQETDQWALDKTEPNITVPVCHLTGWWDYVARGTVAHFVGLQARGAAGLRDKHRLVIGPWSHRTGSSAEGSGVVDYGPAEHVSYHDEIADWYDYALQGNDRGTFAPALVKAFVLNENRWRHYDSWPPPGGRQLQLFLHSDGAANTPRGDGTLAAPEPSDHLPSEYIYDPNDPVISRSTWSSRALSQAVNDDRSDVLVYVTEPLERTVTAIGDATLTLWVSSDAPETDFTAKLIEVRPDGTSIELSWGIVRTRFLDGYDQVVRLEPGVPRELTLELGPVGIRFDRGSRIRLDVSSSDFPNFDRNHNTGADYWSDAELRPARQRVYSDSTHPSRLTLPIEANS